MLELYILGIAFSFSMFAAALLIFRKKPSNPRMEMPNQSDTFQSVIQDELDGLNIQIEHINGIIKANKKRIKTLQKKNRELKNFTQDLEKKTVHIRKLRAQKAK